MIVTTDELRRIDETLRKRSPASAQDDAALAAIPTLAAVPEYPIDVLPSPARLLVRHAERVGLPAALAGGAALAAMATAVGPDASVTAFTGWTERAILWVPLLAPRGAGKSPAQKYAFGPLRDHDARAFVDWHNQEPEDRGSDPTVLVSDSTLEALARRLAGGGGAVGLDVDELQEWIKGLGQYKRGGGGDRGRLLTLWTGDPWRYTRVGGGKNMSNEVDVLIARPTVVICGGLQPPLHGLLGGEEDGLRPRWLPHLAEMPKHQPDEGAQPPLAWGKLLREDLLPARREERRWSLTPAARSRFQVWRATWKGEARGTESASTSAALVKADTHALRIAFVFAEGDAPGAGGEVGPEVVDRAAMLVSYTLDCWRALPEQGSMALSRRDEVLDRGVDQLRDWLEQRAERKATKSEILRANVAGVRTASLMNLLIEQYKATYPGTVGDGEKPARGPVPVVVSAPDRRPAAKRSTTENCLDPNSSKGDTYPLSGQESSSVEPSASLVNGSKEFPPNSSLPTVSEHPEASAEDPGWLANSDDYFPYDLAEVEP